MSDYLMIDGKKTELSKESAENIKKELTPEPKHGDIVLFGGWGKRYIFSYWEKCEKKFRAFDEHTSCCEHDGVLDLYADGSYKVIGNLFNER